jgi:hypothetical protein
MNDAPLLAEEAPQRFLGLVGNASRVRRAATSHRIDLRSDGTRQFIFQKAQNDLDDLLGGFLWEAGFF